MEIKGQGILLTGASTGIGHGTAKELAKQGARLVLLDVNKDALMQTAKETNALPILCDVSDEQAVEKAVSRAVDHLGSIRALLNVAGVAWHPRLLQKDGAIHSAERFERLIAVNLTGTFNCCRFVAKHMSEQAPLGNGERGVIVNTASISAYESPVGGVAYAASKAGVVGMTLPMARELGEHAIRVMTIAPGPFMTPLFASFRPDQKERFAAAMAFPKEPADPRWFAKLAIHIIENEFLNGEVIRLDGGTRLPRKY